MDLSSATDNIGNMFTQSRVAASLSSKSLSDVDARNSGSYRDSVFNIEDEEQLLSNAPAVPNIHVFWLPFIGRAQFVRDLAGYIQWSIILSYWVYGNYSTWFVILLPHYSEGRMSVVMLMIYAAISLLCLTSFIRASTSNPGTLNNHQQPEADWAICGKCCRRRPPLSHHCRRCGQCVRKMDHHCPWINNCVGEDNQYAFMQLVAYAYILSLTTLVLDIVHMYYLPQCLSCDQSSFASRYERVLIWVAIVMAILMTCGAAGLYMSQHISILFETPSIEWMRIQHVIFTSGPSAVKWPVQTKSACTVYRTTCGEGPWFLWPFPCRRRRPVAVSHYV